MPHPGSPITPLSKGGGSIGGILSDHQIKFVGLILKIVTLVFIQRKLPLIMVKMPITNAPVLKVEGNTAGISI